MGLRESPLDLERLWRPAFQFFSFLSYRVWKPGKLNASGLQPPSKIFDHCGLVLAQPGDGFRTRYLVGGCFEFQPLTFNSQTDTPLLKCRNECFGCHWPIPPSLR